MFMAGKLLVKYINHLTKELFFSRFNRVMTILKYCKTYFLTTMPKIKLKNKHSLI